MPYLYCDKHGRERETGIIMQQDTYRQADEFILVVRGTLKNGPWLCDSCNGYIRKGDRATLVSAFPSHCRRDLYDYNFAYERQYFRMNQNDTATAYGAAWPDNSIRNRRSLSGPPQLPNPPVCALEPTKAKT